MKISKNDEKAFLTKCFFVLACIDMELKRLVRLQHQMKIFGSKGDIYCFGFQKDVIRKYCGEKIKFSEVDFEVVKGFLD